MRVRIAGLLLLLTAIAAPQARADCVAACMTAENCTDASPTVQSKTGASCASMEAFCQGQCQPPGNGTRYGVIAYSATTGAWGGVHGYTDPKGAETAALATCSRHASDCAVVVRYADTCVAVSVSKDGVLAWDNDAKSRGLAENRAKQDCTRKGGVDCRVVASDCSQ